MLYSLKVKNTYLKGETFEDNDSNFLFYEVVNSIKWYEMFLALIFS